jgi:hypothetical protein
MGPPNNDVRPPGGGNQGGGTQEDQMRAAAVEETIAAAADQMPLPGRVTRYARRLEQARATGDVRFIDEIYVGGAVVRKTDPEILRLRRAVATRSRSPEWIDVEDEAGVV